MQDVDDYFLRLIEAAGSPNSRSFSNRYMHWKRFNSIEQAFKKELCRIGLSRQPIRVLDIGCGDGWLINNLKAKFGSQFNIDFIGIDMSEFDINFANKKKEYFSYSGCNFKLMDAGHTGFPDETFDIIVSTEVIEHLPEPGIVISEMQRVLKKTGLVILTTPNETGSPLIKFLRIIRFKKILKDSAPIHKAFDMRVDHVSLKTASQWRKVFKEEGFSSCGISGTGGMFYGSPAVDRHRMFFALYLIMDIILEFFPFSYFWSELLFFKLRKNKS